MTLISVPRCPSLNRSMRCALPLGHPERAHANGAFRWPCAPAEPLALAQAAAESRRDEERLLEKMCEPCRKLFVRAWAKRLADSLDAPSDPAIPR